MNKTLMIGGIAMTLMTAGCRTDKSASAPLQRLKPTTDAPVAEVAAIDRMTGEELTRKCIFERDGYVLPYRLHAPAKIEPNTLYPLVLFLHGAGERGNDNTKTLVHGVVPICRYAMKHGDAFVVVPQCPSGKKWVNQDWSKQSMRRPNAPSEEMVAVMALVRELKSKYPIAHNRIYVTGISMGGFGTWDIVSRMPGFFAAMMPICGGVDEHRAEDYRDCDNLGIRIFHGGADNVVSPDYSRRMDKALTDAGIVHGYTEYPGVGHDCWTQTYSDEDVLRWLFGRKRKSWDVRVEWVTSR